MLREQFIYLTLFPFFMLNICSSMFHVQMWEWCPSSLTLSNISLVCTVLYNSIQLAVCTVHANKGGAQPGVNLNLFCHHSPCEASHIFRVKGEIFYFKLCGLTGTYTVWQDAAAVAMFPGEWKKLRSTAQKERNQLCPCPPNPSTLLFSSLSITRIPNGYECFSARFPQSYVLTIASHCKWHLQGRGRPSFLYRGHASKSISLEMRFTE